MNQKAKDQIAKGRAGLILDAPFFGSLVMRLTMVETAEVKTMATNGDAIKYNPEFVEKELSLDATKGVLAHEVMHCAMAHHVRQGARDTDKWNDACDHAINHILIDSGFTLTEGALHADAFKGMSAEQIYARLPNDKDDPNRSQDGDGGGMGKVEPPSDGKGQPKSSVDQKKSEQDWKVATAQAAQQAKAMGQMPGGLERAVGEIVNPKVDWLEVLRQFVSTTAKNDYAWYPPNRRYLAYGMYLPSTRSEELGDVTAIIDTSCSVDDEAVNQFAAELVEISEHYRVKTRVIHCDTEVQLVEDFEIGDEIEIHPKGRGGTDFRPPFKEIEDSGEIPPCAIYLTDGECDRFPDDPGYPVLWAIYGRLGESFDPPFGDVVVV